MHDKVYVFFLPVPKLIHHLQSTAVFCASDAKNLQTLLRLTTRGVPRTYPYIYSTCIHVHCKKNHPDTVYAYQSL